MQKDIIEAIRNIDKGDYSNVYFIQGDEEYYIDLIIDRLRNKVLKKNEISLDLTIAYGKEVNIIKIIEYAKRLPMIAQKQLVIIKDAQEIADFSNENSKKSLEAYLNYPNPRTILVFAYKNKTVDKRTSLGKALIKATNFITSKKLYDNQISHWIHGFCTSKKIAITSKAASMLHEFFGNNLTLISKEIIKIYSNLKENQEIDDDIVQKYTGVNRNFNVFELQSAIANKDLKKTITILRYFEQNPKACPLVSMLSIIYSLFIKIIQIHMSNGKSTKELAEILKVNPYFLNEYLTAANKYPPHKALEAIQTIHDADLMIKNYNYPQIKDSQIAQELVSRLML